MLCSFLALSALQRLYAGLYTFKNFGLGTTDETFSVEMRILFCTTGTVNVKGKLCKTMKTFHYDHCV